MPSDPDNFPFVLIGNKIDMNDQRLISSKFAIDWCKAKNNMTYFETSVKEGINVVEAFRDGTKRALNREKERRSFYDDIPNHIKITNTSNDEEPIKQATVEKNYCGC